MESSAEKQARITTMVAVLNTTLGWGLSEEQQQAYAQAVALLIRDTHFDLVLQKLIVCYHEDHELVEALRERTHLEHDRAWTEWTSQVLAILRQKGIAWSADIATDGDDLVQVALTQLAGALPSFRYASRFSTWAYSVIIQSVRRHLRDQHALKRSSHLLSLDQHPELVTLPSPVGRPEGAAETSVLATLIDDVLARQPDQRLAQIFKLWAIEDLRPAQIGRRVHLSPSRVRVLLAQARNLLRQQPAIQTWSEAWLEKVIAAGRRNPK
jgi:RNA polymerase sigma factor (sigma-70 family)